MVFLFLVFAPCWIRLVQRLEQAFQGTGWRPGDSGADAFPLECRHSSVTAGQTHTELETGFSEQWSTPRIRGVKDAPLLG